LIEVWSMLHRIRPEWTLDIIGNGEWANRLQRQIESFGLNRCICLKSSANHIEEEYMQASLLVMSSRYEGLPMVLLEAQSFGLPIVSFACKCGPRDIITDGEDGFLVPEGELATMADRILTLMDNEVLRKRMGQAAQINCRRFSESVVMEKWERLFLQLVNRKI
jgi:glycosyltransferase involved in cell wall biosynthesis